MKKSIIAFLSFGVCIAAYAATKGAGFMAPEVNGKTNIGHAQYGDIILDQSDSNFWGYNGSASNAGWTKLGTDPANRITVQTATGPTSYVATSLDDVILANGGAGDVTITLPSVTGLTGKVIMIKRTDATSNKVAISGNTGTETIDGTTTYYMTAQYDAIKLVCDGATWKALSRLQNDIRDATSSSFTPTGSGNWAQLTGNSVSLPQGRWKVTVTGTLSTSGLAANASVMRIAISGANGNNTGTQPTGFAATSGVSLVAGSEAAIEQTSSSTILWKTMVTTAIYDVATTTSIAAYGNVLLNYSALNNGILFTNILAERLR